MRGVQGVRGVNASGARFDGGFFTLQASTPCKYRLLLRSELRNIAKPQENRGWFFKSSRQRGVRKRQGSRQPAGKGYFWARGFQWTRVFEHPNRKTKRKGA